MKNFIANGNSLQLTAPVGGVTGGSIYKQGSIIGIVQADAREGDPFTLSITGVYSDVPKTATETWSTGDMLYFKSDTSSLTKTVTGNTFAGYAYSDAVASETKGSIILSH